MIVCSPIRASNESVPALQTQTIATERRDLFTEQRELSQTHIIIYWVFW